MDWVEACGILGVQETASPEEIKAQYFYKANILHPDKTLNLSDAMRAKALQELKLINQAHDFLCKPGNNPFSNPPKLNIMPKHIRFKDIDVGGKKSTTFEINSIGGPYTNVWIDSSLPEWLSVISVKSTTSEQVPLQVTLEATGIGQPDAKYSCDILVRLENGKTKLKDEAKVTTELWIKSESAELVAQPNSLKVDDVVAGEKEIRGFNIFNTGRGVLRGTITSHKTWLSVRPSTININSADSEIYVATVDASSLLTGFQDNDSISLVTNAGDYGIPIAISVIGTDNGNPDGSYAEPPHEESFSTEKFRSTLSKFIGVAILPGLGLGLFMVSAGNGLTFLGLLFAYFVVACSVAGVTSYSKDTLTNGTFDTSNELVIANRFRRSYHKDSCRWAARLSGGYKETITRGEAIRRGYKPCLTCKP